MATETTSSSETRETFHLPLEDRDFEKLRFRRANEILRKYVLLSFGAGAIPMPVVDVAASVMVQLKLVAELSELYGVAHRQKQLQNAVGTLITTFGGRIIGWRIGLSLAKLIPGSSLNLGFLKTATFASISTHLSGKFLIMHFETGGTLLDFDPIAMRNYFQDEFEKSSQAVERMRNESAAAPA